MGLMAGSPIVPQGQVEATTIIPPPMSPGCVWRKKWNARTCRLSLSPSLSALISRWAGSAAIVTVQSRCCAFAAIWWESWQSKDKSSTWCPHARGLAWLISTETHSRRKSFQSFKSARHRDRTWKYCNRGREKKRQDSESLPKKRN